MPSLYILIAAYNEAPVLDLVLTDVKRMAKSTLVVVDDGSSDKTSEIALQHTPHTLTHPINCGKTAAIMTGIAYLKKINIPGDAIIILMDADGQHDPSYITQTVEMMQKYPQARVVMGIREITENTPLANKIGRMLADVTTYFYTGRWYTDSQCGYKAVRWNVLKTLSIQGDTYAFESQFLYHLAHMHIPHLTQSIPNIYTTYSTTKKHKQGFLSGLLTLLSFIK